MRPFLFAIVVLSLLSGFGYQTTDKAFHTVVGRGQMPNLTKDRKGKLHLVYGTGDSILYRYSDNAGKSYSTPVLISIVPKLAASHTRGPQIATTNSGLLVTACNYYGNIFSFTKMGSGLWHPGKRINDKDTVAKEGLMALAADGNNAFSVWLDLRDGHNKIFGSRSSDGGRTWSKNILVYASPDQTVCECCKPSVVMEKGQVYVMFRNWLEGNRDLYLSRSYNGGETFSKAEKLGKGSWPLKGCPMDGGGLVINKNGQPQTVWNRKGIIYSYTPGQEEKELGKGRSCTMETVNGKNVYAWLENGEIIILQPDGTKKNLGKGQMPILKAISNDQVACVWEASKQIHSALIEL